MCARPFVAIVMAAVVFSSTPAAAADDAAAALLERAKTAIGFDALDGRILHYRSALADSQNFQSDRSYPPFFDAMQTAETWFDARTGVERVTSSSTYPGASPAPSTSLYDAAGGVTVRGDRAAPLPRSLQRIRNLNAVAVVGDWLRAGDARSAGTEIYRDYPRAVLIRGGMRLLLDVKTAFPVKLEYVEGHYLWGQQRVEYVYSNWNRFGGLTMNTTAFRLADGEVEISATVGAVDTIATADAPLMSMPSVIGPPPDAPTFLQPLKPDVQRVGASTALLVNTGYTEAVTLAGNEIWVLDATQGERRAALDADAIAALFPGTHKVNVVVTDLAWPHIAGVRYWVAHGATIVAHTAAREFLQRVVDRRWTLAPDELERRRAQSRFTFVGIDSPRAVANGELSLAPIDGIGSEVALIAYVPRDRFLWASDYIQTVAEPSAYASEVWEAVERAGFHPEQTAAQHLRLTQWSVVAALQNARR